MDDAVTGLPRERIRACGANSNVDCEADWNWEVWAVASARAARAERLHSLVLPVVSHPDLPKAT